MCSLNGYSYAHVVIIGASFNVFSCLAERDIYKEFDNDLRQILLLLWWLCAIHSEEKLNLYTDLAVQRLLKWFKNPNATKAAIQSDSLFYSNIGLALYFKVLNLANAWQTIITFLVARPFGHASKTFP